MIQRLVQFENFDARPTPLVLLGQLREIDPMVELVYLGGGDWRLGVVKQVNQEWRTERAELIRAFEARRPVKQRNPKNLALADLVQQGFVQLVQYTGDDPSGNVRVDAGIPESEYVTSIVEDFRRRTFVWLNDPERVFEERLAHTDGSVRRAERAATREDWMHTDGRDQFHRVSRDRKLFGPAGMTGGVEGAMKDVEQRQRRILRPSEQEFDDILAMVAEYEYSGEE